MALNDDDTATNLGAFNELPNLDRAPAWLRVLGRQVAADIDRQTHRGEGINAALVGRYQTIVDTINALGGGEIVDSDDGLEGVVNIDVRRKVRDKTAG